MDSDVYYNKLYIDPRLGPVIWDMNDEVGISGARTRVRGGSRIQVPEPDLIPVSSMSRHSRHLRDSAFTSPQSGPVDDHGRRSIRAGIVLERDDALPISLATKELYHQLEAAAKFYTNFGKGYEKDIASIKKYATKEILESLWIRRVRRARDPTAAAQAQDYDGYNDDDLVSYEDQFAVWKRKLCHALDGVIAASLDETSHDDRNRSYKSMLRMVDKIRTANRQLLPLLDEAWKGQDLCRDLITELNLLKSLVKSISTQKKDANENEHGNSEDNGTVEEENWHEGQDAW